MTLKELKEELLNNIFLDEEGESIEHMDMSYADFVTLINQIIKAARKEATTND